MPRIWLDPILPILGTIFLTLLPNSAAPQQALQPRVSGNKLSLPAMQAMPPVNRIVIKFREGSQVRLRDGRLFSATVADVAASVENVIRQTGVATPELKRLHTLPEATLDAQREAAQRRSGRELADLNLYYVVELPITANAAEVADRLNALPNVEFAEPEPVPAPPPSDTPNLAAMQGYKDAPPYGIGVLDPILAPGSDGEGMSFVDVEYSWQIDHEDLQLPASRNIDSSSTAIDPFNSSDHGTAVLGQIVAQKNGFGVTGIAAAAFAKLVPTNTQQFNYNPARAISLATQSLTPGDVMIIEQQYAVCGGKCDNSQVGCGPIEGGLQSVYDAVSIATALGIVVVAAAGNGNVDLDSASCNGRFDRSVRDSGAIIVGAGAPNDRSRLSFSSFGSRVDVQGWGQDIVTTGYGDAFGQSEILRRYTKTFGGTSGATPIVTGAVLSIQGRLKACHLPLADPTAIRHVLRSTGTPQTGSVAGNIGPLPQLSAALAALGADKCVGVTGASLP